jgi:threonine aldolase
VCAGELLREDQLPEPDLINNHFTQFGSLGVLLGILVYALKHTVEKQEVHAAETAKLLKETLESHAQYTVEQQRQLVAIIGDYKAQSALTLKALEDVNKALRDRG